MTDAAESPFAMKSGVIPRGDHCVLVSSYGKMKRPLALDQAQQSQSPVKGLFSRDYVGPLPSIRTGFNTDMRRFLSTVGLHKAFQTEATTTSIILTGRCEDDQDYGDWIVYTGTDLTGDVNNDEQATHDQKLEGYNLMLAKCCAAPINAKRGSHAHGYWLQGTPIRVIRGSGSVRLSGSSQRYMPYSGFRYDGIYKVVQYKPRRGIQGNIVWQFALRRCDRSPAPWTMKGYRSMMRHCPNFQHEDWEKRNQYWMFMRRVIDNLQPVITYYGEQEEAIEYGYDMLQRDQRQTIGSCSSIMGSQMIHAVYAPPRRLQNAIIADATNRRIWMRVCDEEYQQRVGIQDYLSFIEVALTQPEFQCLLCNEKHIKNSNKEYRDGLSIPLVRADSYHCMRCDYNFCKECIDATTDYDIHRCCCPNCMTLDSMKTNDMLINVFKAAHIYSFM